MIIIILRLCTSNNHASFDVNAQCIGKRNSLGRRGKWPEKERERVEGERNKMSWRWENHTDKGEGNM